MGWQNSAAGLGPSYGFYSPVILQLSLYRMVNLQLIGEWYSVAVISLGNNGF